MNHSNDFSFSAWDKIEEFLLSKRQLESSFIDALFKKDHSKCVKTGYQMFKIAPTYLIFSYFLQLTTDESIERLFLLAMDKGEVTVDILLHLARNNVMLDYVELQCCNVVKKDYMFYLILKYLLLNGKLTFITEEFGTADKSSVVNELLNVLDDWDLYSYAIAENIKVKERNTLNYKYYLAHVECTSSIIEALITENMSYKDIAYLVKLKNSRLNDRSKSTTDTYTEKVISGCLNDNGKTTNDIVSTSDDMPSGCSPVVNSTSNNDSLNKSISKVSIKCKTPLLGGNLTKRESEDAEDYLGEDLVFMNPTVNLTVKRLQSKDTIKESLALYKNNPSHAIIKLVLASLIATKKTEYLVLALYFSYVHKNTYPSNYEVKLIHLFLLRFFCYYPEAMKVWKELDIKNIQLINLSYIWSDILIIKNIDDKTRFDYMRAHMHITIEQLKEAIGPFIEANKLVHAFSIYRLVESFSDSKVMEEIKTGTILTTSGKTIFSDLLGEDCSYVFDKAVAGCNMEFELVTLYSDKMVDRPMELLENDIFDIKDEKFIHFYKKMLSYQYSISK